MTRKEILQYIKSELATENAEIYLDVDDYKIIVEALEQEPTTKTDSGIDCISRQAVLEQAEAFGNGSEPYGYYVNVEDIQALPSVTPRLCEDAISRQALLNATVNRNSVWNKITDSKGDNLEAIISKLPAVTLQLSSGLEKLEKDLDESDCISRAGVIKILDRIEQMVWDGDGFDYDESRALIDELPPVTSQPRWIPVSEKLPNDRDWYLGIFKEPDTGWVNPLPFICDYVGKETKATTKGYWILRGFTDIDNPCDYYLNLECVAWMPLPQA